MPQDYSGQNLRGRSFKGQDLTGANFTGADIRSADFSGATLVGANFSHAKAGLQRRWAILLVLVSWVLMGLSGFLSAFAGALVMSLVFYKDKNDQIAHQIAGWTIIVVLILTFHGMWKKKCGSRPSSANRMLLFVIFGGFFD